MTLTFDVGRKELKQYLDSQGVRIQPEEDGFFTVHFDWIIGYPEHMSAEKAVAYAIRHTEIGRLFGIPKVSNS